MSTREPKLRIGRRAFTEQGLLLLLSGVTITVSACGSDSNPAGATPPQADVSGTISANHGHVAVLTAARITGGGAVVAFDIQGTAAHAHTIDLSAAQIGQIAAKQQVTVTSTTNSQHSHTVTFN